MQVYFVLISILQISCLLVASAELENYTLEQLQVLFRHGDRSPTRSEIFPIDPHNELYKNLGYGQLTKVGKNREYKIGQILRERYDAFLGEYKNNEVYAYSSNFDLTKISLQLVLAGLYPPLPSDSLSDSINWQPIPTHYNDLDVSFLSATNSCPAYKNLYKGIATTPEITEIFKKYQDLFKKITDNTGFEISNLFAARTVYFNLRSSLSLDLLLPTWCSEEDFHELEKISAIAVKAMTHTEQLRRLMAGPLVDQFLKNFKEQKSPKKIYLYSASEYNLAAFVDAHNITGAPVVHDYGSALILEKLRGPDDQIYIRVYLWTGVSEKLISLKFNNCDETCPLSEYEKGVQSILPDDASIICASAKVLCRR